MNLDVVILAGGRGERFWPLSRSLRPKQLLDLVGDRSLLEATLGRVAPRVSPERTWVVIGGDLRPAVEKLALGVPPDRWLWEPVGRNTAAAVGAATERILAAHGDAAILALPADHWIPDPDRFWAAVERGRALLRQGRELVIFGLRPSYPETGYGYIERGDAVDAIDGAYVVSRFHEKPDLELARSYLARGEFYWNAGIFLFRAEAMARLLRVHVPEMATPLDAVRSRLATGETAAADPAVWRAFFEAAPSISLDHGVLERAADVTMIEAEFDWSDLGSWTSLAGLIPADARGNHQRGDVMSIDSEGCVLYAEDGGMVAVLGVRDLIVVRSGDATLVCPRDRAQEVRRLVNEGKADARLRRFF